MRTNTLQRVYIPAPKLNQLRILRQIASDADITQMELASRCDLSVAMVNNYIKMLDGQGLVECRRKSSKTVSYHLTAAGREVADTFRRELLQELVKHFADAKEGIRELILDQAHGSFRRVVLFGSGDLAELAFHALESADVKVVGVCDENPAVVGREWCGREMLSPSQIRFLDPDLVVVASPSRTDESCSCLSYLQNLGIGLIRLDSFGACSGDTPSAAPSRGYGDGPDSTDRAGVQITRR